MPIDVGHDPGGMPTRITREESETAAAFDQRGEIGFAILSPENQKVAFPMSEAVAIRNSRRSCADRIDRRNMETAWLTSVALPTRTVGNGQMAPQLLMPSIDILVDSFVAHRLAKTAMAAKITRLPASDQRYKRRVPACAQSCRHAHDARAPWSARPSDNSPRNSGCSSRCRLRLISR